MPSLSKPRTLDIKTNLDACMLILTAANLVAVLKGDVNGSWTAPQGSQLLPDSYFLDLQAKGIGPAAQWGVIVA